MKINPSFVFGGAVCFVVCLWSAALFKLWPGVTLDALEPLFTGLALAAVIATFLHERRTAEESKKDIANVVTTLVATCQALNRSTRAQRNAAYIGALHAMIGGVSAQVAAEPTELEKLHVFKKSKPIYDELARALEQARSASDNN